jgi:opacity protein-like surface antigen
MRSLFLLLLGAVSAFSQPFSFGVKAGVPVTDFLSTVQSPFFGFNSTTNRYIVGPTVELRLPFGLGVELDALFRHLNYSGTVRGVDTFTSSSTTGNAWEFPLLAKYRFPSKVVRPYVDAGIAWDTLSGLTQTISTTVFPNHIFNTTSSHPQELHKNTTTGFVTGAGLDVQVLFLHLSPEIRYTRWGAQHFLSSNGGLSSNQNQAEFLLGITF